MSLIKSISGIRGTIGGRAGEGLGGVDIVKFTAGYAEYIRRSNNGETGRIVVGRDARLSGKMVEHLVVGTLMAMGFDVVNIGWRKSFGWHYYNCKSQSGAMECSETS